MELTKHQEKERKALVFFCSVLLAAKYFGLNVITQSPIDILGYQISTIPTDKLKMVISILFVYFLFAHIVTVHSYFERASEKRNKKEIEIYNFYKQIAEEKEIPVEEVREYLKVQEVIMSKERKEAYEKQDKVIFAGRVLQNIYLLWLPLILGVVTFFAIF